MNKNLTIDIGYSHLWVEDAKINEEFAIAGGDSGTLIGEFDSSVDIFSIHKPVIFDPALLWR